MFDPFTILTAILPVVTDGIRRIIGRYTGGAQPQTVQELVTLQTLDIQRLQALAQMEGCTDGVSTWVANIRALQRPVVGFIVLAVWSYTMIAPTSPDLYNLVCNLASSVIFYLFGDRTFMYLKNRS